MAQCKHCNKEFVSKNKGHLYCSSDCRSIQDNKTPDQLADKLEEPRTNRAEAGYKGLTPDVISKNERQMINDFLSKKSA